MARVPAYAAGLNFGSTAYSPETGRAGERAQARSAHEDAIGQLRKAIVLVESQPAGAERDARELNLQLALAGSLVAARGYALPETAAAYERAVALSAAVGDAARLGVARTGLAIGYHGRGEVERGRALAAEARGDREQALLGHANVGAPEHFQGKFASSLAHCEQAIALYYSGQHRGNIWVLGTDLHSVAALSHSAWNLWYLGQPDAARARARETVALARRLEDPFSLAYALFCETVVHSLRSDVAALRERATEMVALSETQGFPFWLGLGRAFHAAASVLAGEFGALPEIMGGMALAAETGSQAGAPGMLALLAEAQRAAGQLAEARGIIATAMAVAAQTGQPSSDSDLHRLDGDLLLATGGPADEAAPPAITAPSPSPASRVPTRSRCAQRPASRACGAIRASAPKRATSSHRSTAGSPKASTLATSLKPRRCSLNCKPRLAPGGPSGEIR